MTIFFTVLELRGGGFPAHYLVGLPMVVPGTKTALLVLAYPPPSNGGKIEKVPFFVHSPLRFC